MTAPTARKASLTPFDVLQIRLGYHFCQLSAAELAAMFGCTAKTVHKNSVCSRRGAAMAAAAVMHVIRFDLEQAIGTPLPDAIWRELLALAGQAVNERCQAAARHRYDARLGAALVARLREKGIAALPADQAGMSPIG